MTFVFAKKGVFDVDGKANGFDDVGDEIELLVKLDAKKGEIACGLFCAFVLLALVFAPEAKFLFADVNENGFVATAVVVLLLSSLLLLLSFVLLILLLLLFAVVSSMGRTAFVVALILLLLLVIVLAGPFCKFNVVFAKQKGELVVLTLFFKGAKGLAILLLSVVIVLLLLLLLSLIVNEGVADAVNGGNKVVAELFLLISTSTLSLTFCGLAVC